MSPSAAFWSLLWSRLWPVLVLLALFVGGIFFVKFLMKRFKAL